MAELNQVPVEVLEGIVRVAMPPGVKGIAGQLASVNRIWQSIVEKQSFQELRFQVEDISKVMKILQKRPERFSLVRRIVVFVTLPAYTAADCTVIESGEDRFRNDLVFSKSMNTLFTYLGNWPSTGRTLELQLYPFSPSDKRCIMGNQWFRCHFGVVPGDILHNRAYDSTLELYGKPDNPILAITKLTLRDDCERYVAVSGIERMFHTFTGLRDIDVRFWDNSNFMRRSARRRMAKALETMPDSVGSMRFHVKYYPPADQSFNGQRLCDDNDGSDPLTKAYRNATQKMTIVDIHGMLGTPELFWPKTVNDANPAPFWPNLKYMELYYHILSPTGEWFFEPDTHWPPREQADLPSHDLPARYTPRQDLYPMQNRYTADQDKMDEFYSAVAKAVTNMPKLQHLHVQALTYWSGTIAPFHVFTFKTVGRVARATWSGTPPFEPSSHVLKAWRKMAYERCLFLSLESKDAYMDKLPPFGRGIDEVLLPTFAAYEDLLKANAADIRSARRETHSYGPNPRHVLDVYFPDNLPPKSQTVLVFLHGGGFYAGARVNEAYAGGLMFGNLGRFFTSKFGVTVIVPDYRLLGHGAIYPSGGEDIKFVVDWVKGTLASREGYESINLFLLGNSAGGAHVATFCLDPAFESAREEILTRESGVRLRGAIYLGTPFHWGNAHDSAVRRYVGDETVFTNSPMGKLQEALKPGSTTKLPDIKLLILVSELDPQLLFDTAEEFKQIWPGKDIQIQVLKGHNHISPQLGLSTGIEREEAWGVQVGEFLSSCTSD
ncbi:Alpha/Beta hydrolase protein [Xylaria cf. heliscus]|nr:Alpha/Beta hydrolase protein [Xylaria cf. heliscus]